MLDTVKIDIPLFLKIRELGRIPWTDVKKLPLKKQEQYRLFDKDDDTLPRITYTRKTDSDRAWLKVEGSIPKWLYGSNVYEIRPADIEKYYRKLRKFLAKQLHLPLSRIPYIEQCEVEKLHVCHNFSVNDRLDDYLRVLSDIRLPNYKLIPYYGKGSRKLESLVWKSGSSIIKVYIKYVEVHEHDHSTNKAKHLRDAKGLLRFEVELSNYEMRQRSRNRVAGELLDKAFVKETLRQKLSQLGVDHQLKTTAMDSMIDRIDREDLPTRTKNTLFSFLTRLQHHGEGVCKRQGRSMYYENYRKLQRIFNVDRIVFSDIDLPPLKLSFANKQKKTAHIDGTAIK